MATALAEQFEAPASEETPQDDAPVARDFEAEARQIGWKPQDEFGDDAVRPLEFVDAKTFVERSEMLLPMMKKERNIWRAKFKEIERDLKQATKHFNAAEERAYERAKAEIEARLDGAAEVGDVEGVRKANADMLGLQKDAVKDAPAKDVLLEAREAEIDWRERNPWYDKGGIATDYANLLVDKHKGKTSEMAPAEFFDFIGGEVLKRYPDAGKTPPARTAINPVEPGGTNRRSSGGKGWADMDPEERRIGQAMAARWVKSGILKTTDDFLKTYDFGGKK